MKRAKPKRDSAANTRTPLRDAARSKRAILAAALEEFSEHGHGGARMDAIAERSGISKPMIYAYFGDKDDLYTAALREAYVQIREGERRLELDPNQPESAIRALVSFTLEHFRSKPWFISMLNTENLRRGTTIRRIDDVSAIQSHLIDDLREILDRGVAEGIFRAGLDPVDVYITIASLCYFPISNAYTLKTVFKRPIDDAWLDRHGREVEEMVIRYLKPDGSSSHD